MFVVKLFSCGENFEKDFKDYKKHTNKHNHKKYDIKNKVEIEGKAAMNLKNNCGGERICDEAMRQLNRRVEFQVIKK